MGEGPKNLSSWMGFPLKHVSLVLLTVQYSTLILLLHYSRIMLPVGGRRYLTSTAVFLTEVFKLAVCLTVSLYEISRSLPPSAPVTSLFSALGGATFSGDSWKLAIPAALYTLSNSLQYVGISNLDAATFQVTYQLKIITTAIFSVGLLRRHLNLRKWAALLLLMVGVAIVQIPLAGSDDLAQSKDDHTRLYLPRSLDKLRNFGGPAAAYLSKRSATYEGIEEDMMLESPHFNTSIGLLAVIGACIASGFSGVYFEKVLKDGPNVTSLWIRNVQLAFYSIFPALFIGVIFLDGETIARNGFFDGYNWVVWAAISFQAIGGIAVAFCITYADNIAKTFATSISIVISSLVSFIFFDLEASGNFLLGTAIVLFATYLSGNIPVHRPIPPPIHVESYEKPSLNGAPEEPRDFSIKLPTTPIKAEALSTSRPSSPNGLRSGANKGYFSKHREE